MEALFYYLCHSCHIIAASTEPTYCPECGIEMHTPQQVDSESQLELYFVPGPAELSNENFTL